MKTSVVLDPTEELERKTIETLSSLSQQLSDGLISVDAFQHCLRTLNKATRGLVDEEINYSVDESISELPGVVLRHLFYADAPRGMKLMLLSYELGSEHYTLIDLTDGIRKKIGKNDALNKSAEAYHQYKTLRQRFLKNGFKELN